MNTINFSFPEGMPVTQKTLSDMQTEYQNMKYIADAFGNKVIIGGCEETTATEVQDGLVFYQSDTNDYRTKEVYFFKGGTKQSKVKVIETTTNKVYKDGNSKEVYKERYITFDTNGDINWSDFKRLPNFKKASDDLVQAKADIVELKKGAPLIDEIRQYVASLANGSPDLTKIPTGWSLCDGTNGTIDMRRRFIVGYDGRSSSDSGYINDDYARISSRNSNDKHGSTNYGEAELIRLSKNDNTASQTLDGDFTKNGFYVHDGNKPSGHERDRRPPYQVVVFIQYKG